MKHRVDGEDVDHPSIAASVHHPGRIQEMRGAFDGAEAWLCAIVAVIVYTSGRNVLTG